ncbi:MAG: septal ring lytic transglycosylase RlpA family protein [Pseudomonadota bacterium]
MSLTLRSFLCLLTVGAFLAACASDDSVEASPGENTQVAHHTSRLEPPRHQARSFQVGKPYRIRGRYYRPQKDWNYNEVGVASWYGGKFHGRKTANGEIFDKNQLTAAHTTLPLPVIARVTNLSNGRSIKVRINDRGPFAGNRIIDLSRAAARELDFIHQGTARVRVEVLPEESFALIRGAEPFQPQTTQVVSEVVPPTLVAAVPVREASAVYLQVGSFGERSNARALRRQLEGFGQVQVQEADVNGKRFYRVRMGPFANASAALNARERLAEAGLFRSHLVFESDS